VNYLIVKKDTKNFNRRNNLAKKGGNKNSRIDPRNESLVANANAFVAGGRIHGI